MNPTGWDAYRNDRDEECDVVVVVELLLGLDRCRVSRCTPNILMQNQHRDLEAWAVTVQQNGRLCVESEAREREAAASLGAGDQRRPREGVLMVQWGSRKKGQARRGGNQEYFGFCSDDEEIRCTYLGWV